MKKYFSILSFVFATTFFSLNAQTTMKEQSAGHTFKISIPDYMTKTIGLNDVAAIQYKSVVKDVYGFVIYDTKEELSLAEMVYTSVNEFYQDFIKDFLIEQKKRKVSEPVAKSIGDVKFIETEVTYYDVEAKMEIYYFVGIVETKKSFYKVLNWCAADKKDAFKADFQSILYSLHD